MAARLGRRQPFPPVLGPPLGIGLGPIPPVGQAVPGSRYRRRNRSRTIYRVIAFLIFNLLGIT